jgi:hypothetical protein
MVSLRLIEENLTGLRPSALLSHSQKNLEIVTFCREKAHHSIMRDIAANFDCQGFTEGDVPLILTNRDAN